MENINKDKYIYGLKVILGAMSDVKKENKDYNLLAEILRYYEDTVMPEGIITKEEFLSACNDVGIR